MKKAFIISMIITASEFIAAIVLFPYLPEQIPIHWNIAGAVDGSAGKEFIKPEILSEDNIIQLLLLYTKNSAPTLTK